MTEEQADYLIKLDADAAINIAVKCLVTFTDSSGRVWEQVLERAVYFAQVDFFALRKYDKLKPRVRDLSNELRQQKNQKSD